MLASRLQDPRKNFSTWWSVRLWQHKPLWSKSQLAPSWSQGFRGSRTHRSSPSPELACWRKKFEGGRGGITGACWKSSLAGGKKPWRREMFSLPPVVLLSIPESIVRAEASVGRKICRVAKTQVPLSWDEEEHCSIHFVPLYYDQDTKSVCKYSPKKMCLYWSCSSQYGAWKICWVAETQVPLAWDAGENCWEDVLGWFIYNVTF